MKTLTETQESKRLVESEEEVYATVVHVNDDNLTALFDFESPDFRGLERAFAVRSKDVARRLVKRLGETVRLYGIARWHPKTHRMIDFEILDFDESWEDRHLADLVEENDSVLPLRLIIDDTEALQRERDLDLDWAD